MHSHSAPGVTRNTNIRCFRDGKTYTGMIGLTFLIYDHEKHPNRCDILVESYSDYTSSGQEAEVAEHIMVAAVKAMRLEQSVYVVRKGSRTTVKGSLSLHNAVSR